MWEGPKRGNWVVENIPYQSPKFGCHNPFPLGFRSTAGTTARRRGLALLVVASHCIETMQLLEEHCTRSSARIEATSTISTAHISAVYTPMEAANLVSVWGGQIGQSIWVSLTAISLRPKIWWGIPIYSAYISKIRRDLGTILGEDSIHTTNIPNGWWDLDYSTNDVSSGRLDVLGILDGITNMDNSKAFPTAGWICWAFWTISPARPFPTAGGT